MITPVVIGFSGVAPSYDDEERWHEMNVAAADWYARVVGAAPRLGAPWHFTTYEVPEGNSPHPPTHGQAIRIAQTAFGHAGPFSILGLGTGASGAGSPEGCLVGDVTYRAWVDGVFPRTQMWLLLHEWGHVFGLSHPYGVWERSDTIMGYASTARFEAGDDVGFTEQELATLRANPLLEPVKVEATVPNCIDVSNYSGPITHYQAAALYNAGVRRCVVQLVNERILTHREQIPTLLDAGIEVQFYVYVWFSAGEAFMQSRIAWAAREADAYPGASKMMWLDCEQADTDNPPFDYVHLPVSPTIRASVDAVRQYGYQPGIYTAAWWWKPGAGDSHEWSDLPLWVANYDGDPTMYEAGFGGWGLPAMKQYVGDQTLANVPSVDFNSYVYTTPPPSAPAPFVPDVDRALAALEAAVENIQAASDALTP